MLNRLIPSFNNNKFGIVEVLSRLIVWCTFPICAIFLTPREYGEINLLYTYILILSSIIVFGQGRAVLKFYKTNDSSSVLDSIIVCTIITILIFLLNALLYEGSENLIITAYFISLLILLTNRLRVRREIKGFAFLKLSYAILRLIFLVGSVYLFSNIYYIDFELIVSIIVLILTSFTFFQKNYKNLVLKKNEIYKKFIFGFPLFFQAILLIITQHIDKLFISKYLGKAELGNYALMFAFCSSVSFIFSFYSQRYEVKIYKAKSYSDAKKNANDFVSVSAISSFIFYFLSLFCYYMFTNYINENYIFYYYEMTICFVSQFLNIWILKYSYISTYMSKNILIMTSSGFSAVLSLILLYFFVPIYELNAVVVTLLVSNAICIILFKLQFNLNNKIENNVK